jgi:glycosyltransferase involved in cell wall biosynthesis
MYSDKSIAVVVPCHNEEHLIGRVLDTMPHIVDAVIVVDDVSTDGTAAVVERYRESGKAPYELILIKHEENGGVGAAIVTGYKKARDMGIDVTAVMAGDAQMDPDELPDIIGPVARGECDYAKGNRLFSGQAWDKIPKYRYLGNATLTLMTKIASGYWHVTDSQTGYTAISLAALKALPLDHLWKGYGFPNDMLVHLNVFHYGVRDVPIEPVYGVGERSGIRLYKVIPTLSWLLMKRFWYRMLQKYVIRDFHPLIFFYVAGGAMFWVGALLGLYEAYRRIFQGIHLPIATVVLVALLFTSGLQFLLFGMWFDMEYNKDLK